MRLPPLACAATALALAATPLRAQRATVGIGGGVAGADHRVDMGFGVERSAGTMYELQVMVQPARRWTVWGNGQTGVLHPGVGATLPRELAEVGLDAAYQARPWLDVQAGMRVRSYTTSVGRQRWTLPSLGVTTRVPFALRGLEGLVGLAAHPFAAVSGLPDPQVALSGRAGLRYVRGPWGAEVLYSLDRYDFARSTASQRLEQYTALTVRVRVSGVVPRLPKTETAPAGRRAPSTSSGS